MGLTSAAVVTLSVGITKALVKLWLNDHTIAIAAGQSVTELLGGRVKDAFKKRRVEGQLQAIGDSVAKSVGQLFEREGVDIDPGAQEAVARAVRDALDDPLLTPRGLVEFDLDIERVGSALVAQSKAHSRDFSAAETALYERMLLEAAQRTLRVVEELPNFNLAALEGILSRQTETLAAVDDVLAGLARVLAVAEAQNPERHTALFESRYRGALAQKLDRVELFGISAGTKRYPLTVAFVTLEAERDLGDDAPPSEGAVHEVLGREGQRLWITGEAGAGKTTLLQWLAVQTALDTLPPALDAWSGRVPFFIRLRQFAEDDFPGPSTWAAATLRALDGGVPDGWVNRQLEGDRALVLIDGIDEVPEGRRDAFREWADDLMAAYPDATWVFSSRPLLDGGVELTDVREIALRSMGPAQVTTFIDHWHKAVGAESGDDADDELTTLAEQLRARLGQRPNLRRLITNPLLCAMVCALHRDQRALLPDGREGLYEACCEMLLHNRDEQRGVPAGEASPLSYKQKRVLLTELAWHMLKNRLSRIDVERMDAQFQLAMQRLPIAGTLAPIDLRRFMVERSGLLRMPLPGEVDFVHKSFLEFLAAHAMLTAGDFELVALNATRSGWREVVLHAASQARGAAEAGRLIGALLDRAEQEPAVRHQMVLLALAATSEADELEPPVRARVDAAVEGLGRPGKVSEAEQWSAAGNLVLPLLSRFLEQKIHAAQARAIIRVIAQVSTPEAIALLVRYTPTDDRTSVRQELLYALRSVLPDQHEAYAQVLTPWLFRLSNGELVIDGWQIRHDMGSSTLELVATVLARALMGRGPVTSMILRHHHWAFSFPISFLDEFESVTALTVALSAVEPLSHHIGRFPRLEAITLFGGLHGGWHDVRFRFTFGADLTRLCSGDVAVYTDLDTWRVLTNPDSWRLAGTSESATERMVSEIERSGLEAIQLPEGFLDECFSAQ